MRGSESSLGRLLRDPVMWLDAEPLGWERELAPEREACLLICKQTVV